MLFSRTTRWPAAIIAFSIALAFGGCASWRDTNPEIYDPRADGEQQLAEALRQARAEHKRVLLNLGANWCSDSQAMFHLLSTNAEIQRFISEHYVFDMIDVNKHGLGARNARLVACLGNPIDAGIPVLLVLDENGAVLNNDPAERLADSDHAHPTVVLAYLRKWAGQR
jgi:thiol:disulfide interchange protein